MQKLYLVCGGEMEGFDEIKFRQVQNIDIVGMFESKQEAHQAWKAKAQASVDNAHMRYFIMPIHEILHNENLSVRNKQ